MVAVLAKLKCELLRSFLRAMYKLLPCTSVQRLPVAATRFYPPVTLASWLLLRGWTQFSVALGKHLMAHHLLFLTLRRQGNNLDLRLKISFSPCTFCISPRFSNGLMPSPIGQRSV